MTRNVLILKLATLIAGLLFLVWVFVPIGRPFYEAPRPHSLEFTDVQPFIEVLNDYQVLFDFSEIRDSYLEKMARSKPRTFPHDRICDFLGFVQTPGAEERQRTENLAGGDLLKKGPDGGLLCYPSERSQIYHRQFVGVKNLPLILLAEKNFLEVKIVLKIVRTKEQEFLARQARPRITRANLIWCDAGGKPLKRLERKVIKLFGTSSNRWVNEITADIQVPPGVSSARLDLQFPSVDVIHMKNIIISGAKPHRALVAKYARVKESAQDTGQGVLHVDFAQIGPEAFPQAKLNQGMDLSLRAVRAVYVLGHDHGVRDISGGATYLLGSFLPHSLILQGIDGRFHTLNFTGCDAVEARLAGRFFLQVRAYTYHSGERAYRVIGVAGDSGVRTQKNLGLAAVLPPAGITVGWAEKNPAFLFPCWQPLGRLATLFFSEHADLQSAATERVVMYGNPEKLLTPGQGLLGNGIPLTKTVFALGGGTNKDGTPVVSLEKPEFLELMRQYKKEGHRIEFGLHTASYVDDKISRTRKGLETIKEFGSRIWIDHGHSYNLDCLMRLGWDRSKPDYYLVPDLRKYGYKCAWSFRDFNVKGLNVIRGDVPSNLVFYLPALDDDLDDDWRLMLFSTKRLVFSPGSFSKKKIEELIRSRGVSPIHCYFSFNRRGHIELANGKPVRLAPWFNADLQNLAQARDAGDLHLTPVGDWIDYVLKVRNVSILPQKGESFQVNNGNSGVVKDMTFGLRSLSGQSPGKIYLDQKRVLNVRRADGVTYFWCDVAPGRHEVKFSYQESRGKM